MKNKCIREISRGKRDKMCIKINMMFLFAVGILFADSLHALSGDECVEGLRTSLHNLSPYLNSGNRRGYRAMCALFGNIVEQCDFSPTDKLDLQNTYELSCESEKVQRWLATSGSSSAAQQPTIIAMILPSVVMILISKMVADS